MITDYAIAEKWAGKKVVVFAVPGAFTVRTRSHSIGVWLTVPDSLPAT